MKIHQTDYRFLRQDSYICCSRIFEYATIDHYRKLGVLSKSTAPEIIATLNSARTYPVTQVEIIIEQQATQVAQAPIPEPIRPTPEPPVHCH